MNARIASCVLTSLLLAGAAHANTATPAPAKLASNSFNAPARVTDTRFDAAAHVERGYNLLRQGKHDQAVKMFDKVIADSERQFAGDMRPRLCRSDGQDAAGAIVVDKALCEAHFGKGFALIDLGRGDLAENELRKASQMAPANAHFTNEYAELFKSRRDWQQSYDLFAKAWAVVDKTTGGADTKVAARCAEWASPRRPWDSSMQRRASTNSRFSTIREAQSPGPNSATSPVAPQSAPDRSFGRRAARRRRP
ncbi:tetratricopeptide repeat protein [Novosphingobium panipatense]